MTAEEWPALRARALKLAATFKANGRFFKQHALSKLDADIGDSLERVARSLRAAVAKRDLREIEKAEKGKANGRKRKRSQ